MEILVLVVAILFVMWVGGFFRSLRRAGDMVNDQVTGAATAHKDKVIKKIDTIEIDTDMAKSVKQKIDLLDSIEL